MSIKKSTGPKILLPADLFSLRVLEGLRPPALRILIAMIDENARWHGGKNGRLMLTYAQLVKRGVSRKGIKDGFDELVDRGLIEIMDQGRAGNGEFYRPNQFRLTFMPMSTGGRATFEYRKFIPTEKGPEVTKVPRKKRAAIETQVPEKTGPILVWAHGEKVSTTILSTDTHTDTGDVLIPGVLSVGWGWK